MNSHERENGSSNTCSSKEDTRGESTLRIKPATRRRVVSPAARRCCACKVSPFEEKGCRREVVNGADRVEQTESDKKVPGLRRGAPVSVSGLGCLPACFQKTTPHLACESSSEDSNEGAHKSYYLHL